MNEALQQNEADNTENSEELYERFSITIDKGQEPLRIDKFLSTALKAPHVISFNKPSTWVWCW
ncbi:MAG: hypothetical protein V9F02_03710 [Chitinophagaceae bacterium]